MAENKNLFAGLVRITSSDYSKYTEQKVTGKMVFAEITGDGENAGKYIWANGVEYKVADATNLDELIRRVEDVSQYAINVSSALNDLSTFIHAEVSDLSTHVRTVTDASVTTLETWRSEHADPSLNAFDASLIDHEIRVKNLEDASSSQGALIDDLSTYVHETVDASIDALQAKDEEIDSSITNLSTRISEIAITAADNSIYVNGTSIGVEGDNYISFTTAGNKASVAIKENALVKGTGTGVSDVSLATKGYVDEQIAVLEQALVFKGNITSTADASTILTDGAVEAGWTYVATAAGAYNKQNFESGDLIIVKADSTAGAVANIIVVERNLDGAVTAAEGLTDDYVILGNNNQAVKVSTIEVNALLTAIANANSAIQGVNANSSTSNFIETNATLNSSVVTVQVGAKTHDVSTASAESDGLATAISTKEYVDAKTTDVKVSAILNSSTPNYVEAEVSVDETGRVISASVGVKVIDLSTATAKEQGLADAFDVRQKLEEVEEVMATANATMANTLGLDSSYGVTWSGQSEIPSTASYKEAIEGAYKEAHKASVTTFGGKTGDITLTTNSATAGDVNFAMSQDGSILSGTVVGWSELDARVTANDASISDLSTNVVPVLQAKDTEIDASINRLNASVNAIESDYIKSVTGESALATSDYVAVTATETDQIVTLTSSITLATKSWDASVVPATASGLATDAYVNNYVQEALLWGVITD